MRYYAIIDDEQRGPFSLEQLPEAGVRPSTFVWCKGMDDWEKAEDVGDICRLFRRRIHDLMNPSYAAPAELLPDKDANDEMRGEEPGDDIPPMFRRALRNTNDNNNIGMPHEAQPDTDVPPQSMLFPAILATVFCFPLTGIVAIIFAIKSARSWQQALADNEKSKESSAELRDKAHDYCRQAKMWTGITISFGMIAIAFLSFNFSG